MGDLIRRFQENKAVKTAVLLFVSLRLFLTIWAIVSLAINPLPPEPDEQVRPYLGEPILNEGLTGLLLGPWQRFDTQHYIRIARQGYADPSDSVFPPLYPLLIRLTGSLFGGTPVAYLAAAILIANSALLIFLIRFFQLTAVETDEETAVRALVYLLLFPSAVFLYAAYTEPLFMLLSLETVWQAKNGRFWRAGLFGFLAALTRLTGWILIVPLFWACAQSSLSPLPRTFSTLGNRVRELAKRPNCLASLLPGLGLILFLLWRQWLGLPSLATVYARYWYQQTGIPGYDILRAAHTIFGKGIARAGEPVLYLDFAITWLLLITTWLTFRRLGSIYGLYSAMMLFFMLLPTSELKPLYSFDRYALAFFPMFILLGMAGKRPWLNRIILYPSLALYLYLSGQFFVWGWAG